MLPHGEGQGWLPKSLHPQRWLPGATPLPGELLFSLSWRPNKGTSVQNLLLPIHLSTHGFSLGEGWGCRDGAFRVLPPRCPARPGDKGWQAGFHMYAF